MIYCLFYRLTEFHAPQQHKGFTVYLVRFNAHPKLRSLFRPHRYASATVGNRTRDLVLSRRTP